MILTPAELLTLELSLKRCTESTSRNLLSKLIQHLNQQDEENERLRQRLASLEVIVTRHIKPDVTPEPFPPNFVDMSCSP